VDVSDLAAEVAEATALIPALASATDLEVTPLTGVINLNNHSYRATTAGRSYLLRLPGGALGAGVRRDMSWPPRERRRRRRWRRRCLR